ncbi:hypothetical protein C481_02012 [Natrialba asiatica DSM 12278]|uniref:Uncharacterized protein n=1 Tax=Natrialba asiatica (strain ATCC 700177 / DSM 12278 / JCM 9576 / FERM P-10747 / NBRC 102637 / 172P1) TaxID=29540 RepID=M0B3T1_NATA1|nr:hypothetical protein C481_02012 [Natrialba asiatica DSM 12278]
MKKSCYYLLLLFLADGVVKLFVEFQVVFLKYFGVVFYFLDSLANSACSLGEGVLEELQFGGKRNYGYGGVQLKDTQMVDLDELDYSRLEGAETYLIELVTPFVLASEYPEANDRTIPGGGPRTVTISGSARRRYWSNAGCSGWKRSITARS